MQGDEPSSYKYVFVCGLHRSGTSVLGRNIARLENCTGFKNTPKFMEEGQTLQDVYPFESEYSGPGRFGFDSRAHLTEMSNLLTPENMDKLRASWHAYWDNNKTIFVEKTPGNIVMTRFLQAAFPNSYFIVIRRHPLPVSMSTQKMSTEHLTSLHRLFEHWLRCYELFEEDKKYLKRVYELTYEDYVDNPAKYHQVISTFIGTHVPEKEPMEEVGEAHNRRYFDQWFNLLTHSFFRIYYRYIAGKYESRFAKYRYSLTKVGGACEDVFGNGSKVPEVTGNLCCIIADAYALVRRVSNRLYEYFRMLTRPFLPEFALVWIRKRRWRQALSKQSSRVVSS